jgi:hypothetical protein
MKDTDDENSIRSLAIKNYVLAMFVAAQARTEIVARPA